MTDTRKLESPIKLSPGLLCRDDAVIYLGKRRAILDRLTEPREGRAPLLKPVAKFGKTIAYKVSDIDEAIEMAETIGLLIDDEGPGE